MKRLCPLFLLVMLTCCLSVTAQEKNPLLQSGILLTQGSQLYDSGQYKQAIATYSQIDHNDTNYVRALYDISLCYTADSQFQKAADICQKAIALKEDLEKEPDLYNQWGNAVSDGGDPERALGIFDTALAKYPAYSLLYLNKGTALIKKKRFAEAEAVYRKVLIMDPYSYSSHFKLGLCALNRGQLIPAMLSFTAYLLMQPNGRYHVLTLRLLNQISRNQDDVQQLVNDRKESTEENYQLLEQIVQSKIALDKSYKPIIHLDDGISRQIQVIFEKIQFVESDTDFYMQYYVPYFKSVFTTGQFEPFINYIFSGVNIPEIQEYNKKYKKEIKEVTDKAGVYFDKILGTRDLIYKRRPGDSILWLHNHGEFQGNGVYLAKSDKLVGPWDFCYNPGNIKTRTTYDENGKRTGDYIYYYFDGLLKGKEFYRQGKQEGEETYYFRNGAISSHSSYKDGLPEGESDAYYYAGGIHTITNFQAGKKEGIKITFTATGDTSLLENYRGDALNGEVRTWHANKRPDVIAGYVNGELDGPYKKFYNTGQLNAEGAYRNGKLEGLWKFYHPNGQLKEQVTYVNDKQVGEYKEYHDNGQLKQTLTFRNGKINGDVNNYDDDGRLFSVQHYESDMIQKASYMDKTGKTIGESQRKGKTMDLTDYLPDGSKRVQLPYNEKGDISGMETFYFPSGKIFQTDEYVDGKEQGLAITYYTNGEKKVQTNYVDGKMDGYYQSWFHNGTIQEEGWYKNNTAERYWMTYNEMGDLIDSTYFVDGEVQGYKETYWPNGKKEYSQKYRQGWLEEWIQFDSSGNQIQHLRFPGGKGRFNLVYPGGKPFLNCNYVNGQLSGPRNLYFFDGKPMTKDDFIHGTLDGKYKNFYHSGIVNYEGNYSYGEKSGTWTGNFENGKPRLTEQYVHGQLSGLQTNYYDNGKVESEIAYKYGLKNGPYKKFNTEGILLYQLIFKDNKLVGYTYPDKSGNILPAIPVVRETAKIKTYFANGTVSGEFEYQDGYLVGAVQLFHDNGKLMSRSEYDLGDLQGPRTTYYTNGQVRGDYHYLHDNLHGFYREYNEKGNITEEGTCYGGLLHGTVRLFDDNGKLKETHHYYYGTLLSITDERSN